MRVSRLILSSALLLFTQMSSTLAHASETQIPELRDGAKICDVDPKTGLRAVILPTLWREVTEKVVTGEARTELIPTPAAFNFDGTLKHPAMVKERLIPNSVLTVTRDVMLYPQTVLYINSDRSFVGHQSKINQEKFYMRLASSRATKDWVKQDEANPWDRIFNNYVQIQKNMAEDITVRLKRDNGFSLFPQSIVPDLRHVRDISSFNIPEDVPISYILEPVHLSYKTETEISEDWKSYATRYATGETIPKLECDGSNVVEVNLLEHFPIPHKTSEDIGVKIPRIVSIGKIRKFNIHGAEFRIISKFVLSATLPLHRQPLDKFQNISFQRAVFFEITRQDFYRTNMF